MGKITVKHFINVNLKPYLVRGEKLYPVYIMITVNRKTTKVKSHAFSELHSESDFDELIQSDEATSEAIAVENLIVAQTSWFTDSFDTNLFSAFYNLMPEYSLIKSNSFYEAINQIKNDLSYDLIFRHSGSNTEIGLTFFDWFKPEFQKQNMKVIKKNKLKVDIIKSLDEIVLVCFFEILDIIVRSQWKYKTIQEKYPITFEEYEQFAIQIAKKIK